ncbi:MAG: AAA family ATPase, partial [Dehalococcoidia bacterium]|nr:AAA family ATPase [Dehalococcoidia bacterium]
MTQRETLTPETSGSVSQAAANIKDNIERVLVGKGGVIELTLAAVLSSGHILIEDVPGIGKTTLARTLASSLDCTFQRIQFTPDLMPSDITGINYYNQKSGEFEFRPGPIIAQIVLADEINRATPRTQSALLEAMAERQLTVDDITITLPVPFLVIATQNPIELEGTFPLPEAQLDRFMLRLRLGYPTEDEEEAMLTRFQTADPLNDLAAVVGASDITELQESVRQVHLDPVLRNYLVQLVQATRTHADVE